MLYKGHRLTIKNSKLGQFYIRDIDFYIRALDQQLKTLIWPSSFIIEMKTKY